MCYTLNLKRNVLTPHAAPQEDILPNINQPPATQTASLFFGEFPNSVVDIIPPSSTKDDSSETWMFGWVPRD